MIILVTGGAGFIGSAVVRHLINETDHSVISLDKLTYAGNLESVEVVAGNSRYAFEQVDICNPSELRRVFEQHQPTAVMHLAAESHVDRSIDGPEEFLSTNILGTFHLLQEARRYWMQLEAAAKESFRFHHISTDEVYGDLDDSGGYFTESTAYDPALPIRQARRVLTTLFALGIEPSACRYW